MGVSYELAFSSFLQVVVGWGNLWLFEGKANARFLFEVMHTEQVIPSLSSLSQSSFVRQSL